jgi:hypothetical protein
MTEITKDLIFRMLSYLKPISVKNLPKKRYGKNSDGGYVIIDGLKYDNLYSYGVGRDLSFEEDFVKRHDLNCYCYDHNVKCCPQRREEYCVNIGKSESNNIKINFILNWDIEKYGVIIRPKNTNGLPDSYNFIINNNTLTINRHDKNSGWCNDLKLSICKNNIIWKKEGVSDKKEDKLNTIENHLIENKDYSNNLFLKIDVEGAEWNVFKNIKLDTLLRFKQIVIELHGLGANGWYYDKVTLEDKIKVLKKLSDNYNIVHVHHNKYSPIYTINEYKVPSVLEVTYLRKDIKFDIGKTEKYPIKDLDYCNNPYDKDEALDFYPFTE